MENLNKEFKIGNDGFVRCVDIMGDDNSIVQAARTSYGNGTKTYREDRALIRYLMRHWHTTPFEMCEIKLHVRVPMDCWRQWVRHRTASINEYSTRYSEAIDSRQITDSKEWRSQSKNNKQGSGDFLPENIGLILSEEEKEFHKTSFEMYKKRLNSGVAREQARKDLPLSTYTEAYWKCDLHNLFNFLRLRMHKHAQKEIREFATIIGKNIVANWVPLAWEAFVDYRLYSENLSRMEVSLLREILSNHKFDNKVLEEILGSKREVQEFNNKFGRDE